MLKNNILNENANKYLENGLIDTEKIELIENDNNGGSVALVIYGDTYTYKDKQSAIHDSSLLYKFSIEVQRRIDKHK